jgi:hypothetical protein
MQKLSFEAWEKEVNRWIEIRSGMSLDDLPDCCYYDWYEAGMNPKRAAKKAIRNAMGEEDEDD